MRNIISILLIVAAIGIFFGFIEPMYADIQNLQSQEVTYDDALTKVDQLKQTISAEQQKINAFNPADLARLNKLLPDNIDNVKLIIDINSIASNFGLGIQGIQISQADPSASPDVAAAQSNGQSYDSVDLSFNVTSSYGNFINFLKAIEESLRLVDITSVSFSPGDKGDVYNFHVTVRTYWLK